MSDYETRFYKKAIAIDDECLLADIKEKASKESKPSWARRLLMPIAVCLLVALAVCFAVEPVRAAIIRFFEGNHSIGDYVAQPSDARISNPEVDDIIAKSNTGQAGSMEFRNMLPEWQEWADGLNPQMGDVFYDGSRLIYTFDMGGGVEYFLMNEHFGSSAIDEGIGPISLSVNGSGYVILNGEKYLLNGGAKPLDSEYDKYSKYFSFFEHSSEEGRMVSLDELEAIRNADSLLFSGEIDLSRDQDNSMDWYYSLPEDERAQVDESMERTKAFDSENDPFSMKPLTDDVKLEGEQQVEMNLLVYATDYSKEIQGDGWVSYESYQIGILNVKFSFNAYESIRQKHWEIEETFDMKGDAKIRLDR